MSKDGMEWDSMAGGYSHTYLAIPDIIVADTLL